MLRKSTAFVPRYQKFESIPLQRGVRRTPVRTSKAGPTFPASWENTANFVDFVYPPPPDLATAAPIYTPAELFWILKHGIKMTGMPAWSDHSDEELWATVGFLEKLPGMSEEDYAKLVMADILPGASLLTRRLHWS